MVNISAVNDLDNSTCVAYSTLTLPLQASFSVPSWDLGKSLLSLSVLGLNMQCRTGDAGTVIIKTNYNCNTNPDTCHKYFRFCDLVGEADEGQNKICQFSCVCDGCTTVKLNLNPSSTDQSSWEICEVY